MRPLNSVIPATLLALVLLFSGCHDVYGQSATIKDVWIERNYSYGGQYYMAIHSDIVFHNLLYNECRIMAFFYDDNGDKVKSNGYYDEYTTVGGYVIASEAFTPNYIDCEVKDYVLYIPNKAICPKSWTQNYHVELEVFCRGKTLAEYYYKNSRNSFSMSSSDYYAYAPRSSSSSYSSSSSSYSSSYSSSGSSSGSSSSSSNSGSLVGAIAGAALIGAAIYGVSKLSGNDSSSGSSSSSSSSSYSSSSSSRSSSSSYGSKTETDFFDPRNIPSHWNKARVCVDGEHEHNTVSRGDATRCFKCGKPFDGTWGDRGVFDGYVCTIHNKWIPRGDYCRKCADEGLVKPYK